MTQGQPASAEGEDAADLPRLADALPAAEHHCRRAVAHLEGRTARGDLLEALVALLEAAGGPDVGNVVRSHLERTAATVPALRASDRARLRVLLSAARLHAAAEHDLRERLRAAGLVGDGRQPPDPALARATRARHAERVLDARRSAVDRVVHALAADELPATGSGHPGGHGGGHWVDALVGDLPASVSQGETGDDATAR